MNLDWDPVTDTGGSGLRGYQIYRDGVFLKEVTPADPTTTDTGLIESTVYSYVVRAVDNATNVSDPSNTASANTPACNEPPVAEAGPPQSTAFSKPTRLDGSASEDPDGTIKTYAWNLGDGTAASGKAVNHTYAAPGSYTATLAVTDNDGAQDSDTATVTVTPPTGGVRAHIRSQRFGGAFADAAYAIAIDRPGNNVVITGEFAGSASFGGSTFVSAGGEDIFLGKYTMDGVHLWSKRIGGTGNDRGQGIAFDPNGDVLVTGMFDGTVDFGNGPLTSAGGRDIFVAKYSGSTGAAIWSKRLGSTGDDFGYNIATDSSGNVAVAGAFVGTVDFGGGPLTTSFASPDAFLVEYTGDGNHVWSKRFGNSGNDAAFGVAIDSNDNVAITGSFEGGVDFGTGVVKSNDGSDDIFVAEYSAAGVPRWTRAYGNQFGDFGNSLTTDVDGNVIVTGTFRLSVDFGGGPLSSNGNTPADIFLLKLDPNGQYVWAKRFGGSSFDNSKSVIAIADPFGNVILTGYFQNDADFGGGAPLMSAGGYDIVVAKYSNDGTYMWAERFGAAGIDYGLGVVTDRNGDTIFTGAFSETVDFGGGPLTSAGDRDVMMVTLGP